MKKRSTQNNMKRFQEITSTRPLPPEVKSALDLMVNFISRVNVSSFDDFSFDSANFAPINAFVKLHDSSRLHLFKGALHRCLRWSRCKVVPRSQRMVESINSDGSPYILPKGKRGTTASLTHDQALHLAHRWNDESKHTGSLYRFSVYNNPPRWGEKFKVIRYELLPFTSSVSLDALDYVTDSLDVLDLDEDEISDFVA